MKTIDKTVLEKSVTIKWSEDVTIENIQEKKDEIIKAFETAQQVLLDVSELSDIDMTAVQLVVAAKKEGAKLNKAFLIDGTIPKGILDFIKRIGIHLEAFSNEADATAGINAKLSGAAHA